LLLDFLDLVDTIKERTRSSIKRKFSFFTGGGDNVLGDDCARLFCACVVALVTAIV
jgi:hypothetical protein